MQKGKQIWFSEKKIHSFDYHDILNNNFVPLKDELMDQYLVLFQDNISIHKSASTSDWLSINNIKTLDIATKSSDLNPIENLWRISIRQVYAERKQFDSIAECNCETSRQS